LSSANTAAKLTLEREPIVTTDGPNLRDLGVTAGVMGAIRYPSRICIVYQDDSEAHRFILVPYAEEIAAWRQVREREWTALEVYEVLDVTPAELQWVARASG
jgi:hypothetical protein